MLSSHSRRTNSGKNHKYPVIGQVRDFYNDLWNVRDVRAGRHGFNLLYGLPVYRLAGDSGGQRRHLIVTRELVAHWEAHKTRHDGILFDLPAGRTTLKRARRRLGFHYDHDGRSYWKQHIQDLEKLSVREIAARHNVDVCVARLPGPSSPAPGLVAHARKACRPTI